MLLDDTGVVYHRLQALCYGMHYTFFDRGIYNINIIALRALPGEPNKFDDYLSISYRRARDEPVTQAFKCTTDPGTYYLNNPMRTIGTAVIAPQQVRGGMTIGNHKRLYSCLVQNKPLKVYRDNNRDSTVNYVGPTIETPNSLQIHRASANWAVESVNKYSAGCIVVQDPKDFEEFMTIVYLSVERYGDKFTFTLIELERQAILSVLQSGT
mgnify:CR=1 FL=1